MKNLRISGIFAAAGGAALLSGSAIAQSNPPAARASASAQAGEYWTAERMAAAIPKDVARAAGPNALFVKAAPGATGSPGSVDGIAPKMPGLGEPPLSPIIKNKTAAPSPAPQRAATTDMTPVPADGSYPGPNDTYEYGPKYRTFPLSTVGKLFFTEPGGNYVCSATVTYGAATQKNLIWTAGHCVGPQGGKSYYTNFRFCPSYDASQGGENPAVGCWNWSNAQLTGGWYYNGSWSRDYAYIILQPTGSKIAASVSDVTGGLGFAWNWARDQHWTHAGYPSASPYTGGKLVVTATEHRYDDASDADGPGTNAWGSAQTPGSSGSALIKGFSYSGGLINSSVSFYYTSPNNEYGIMLHGPYYDTAACNFWKGGTGWTGTC